MPDFYTYMLKCRDKSYYVGHTDDIERRIAEHKFGGYSQYTSERLPVSLVFVEAFATRDEAFAMERRIKGWSRAKKEALIRDDWEEIVRLSNIKKTKI